MQSVSWCINDVYEPCYDINIYGVNYRCTVNGISKSETVYLLQNTDLSQKSGTWWNNFSLSCRKLIVFGNIEIKKLKFHHHKNLTLLEDVDINNIQVCSMVSSDEKTYKYFANYKNDDH